MRARKGEYYQRIQVYIMVEKEEGRAAISHRAFVEALSFAGLVLQELVLWNQSGTYVGQYGFIRFPLALVKLSGRCSPASAPYD